MIDKRYVQTMARYNIWQNNQLRPVLEAMPVSELTCDRGSFFGGLLATANHLLWGDTIWMSRFDPSVEAPDCDIPESPNLHPTITSWAADRFRIDGKIAFWASGLRSLDLHRDLTFYSGVLGRDATVPLIEAEIHFSITRPTTGVRYTQC